MVSVDAPDLRGIAAALKTHAPDAVPIMRAHLRTVANESMVPAARAAAAGIRFETVTVERAGLLGRKSERVRAGSGRTGATTARARARQKYTQSLAEAAATGKRQVSARRWKTLTAQHGLRAGIARGIRSQVSVTKADATVAVRTYSAPAFITSRSSRRSARNRGQWRHPVFANKAVDRRRWAWVTQRITDPLWWDKALAPGSAAAGRAMEQALDEWAALVEELITRAAH